MWFGPAAIFGLGGVHCVDWSALLGPAKLTVGLGARGETKPFPAVLTWRAFLSASSSLAEWLVKEGSALWSGKTEMCFLSSRSVSGSMSENGPSVFATSPLGRTRGTLGRLVEFISFPGSVLLTSAPVELCGCWFVWILRSAEGESLFKLSELTDALLGWVFSVGVTVPLCWTLAVPNSPMAGKAKIAKMRTFLIRGISLGSSISISICERRAWLLICYTSFCRRFGTN